VVASVNDEDNGSALVSVAVSNAEAGRPKESGTVGQDVPLADLQSLASDKSYAIRISSDVPTGVIANLDVTLLQPGDTAPASILGLGRLLETKANLAMQQVLAGATIRCVPGSSGRAIRANAFFTPSQIPGALQARITFAPGAVSEGKGDADKFLRL